ICLIATVGVHIGSRMDFYGLVYAVWLFILWIISIITISHLELIQNFHRCNDMSSIPDRCRCATRFCIEYPWYYSTILRRLQNWMFLPDPIKPPSPYKILCDVILLVLVCRQSLGFRIERRHRTDNYAGGSNEVIIQNYEKVDFENPYIDHMTYTKSSLDLLKKAVFSAMLWVTLAVTFTAGTSRVNILSIGYLIGSFIFLWQGNDLYLRRIQSILKWWNWLLGYNVVVILIKTVLQIAGCMFMEVVQHNACWLVQLLGIGCMNKFGDIPKSVKDRAQCTVPDADIGLAWDGLCFSFLLMQRRFFHSYYFFHHIDETKAMTILQSRGAQLIEELRQHQLQEQQSQERKLLEKFVTKWIELKHLSRRYPMSHTGQVITKVILHTEQPTAPLAVQSPGVSSSCSPRGYHTPISEEAPRSFLQAPTPVSAIMTTMEGYLEPQRMSFSSPASELNPRTGQQSDAIYHLRAPSPDESFPVFSPPPYGARSSTGVRNIVPPPLPAHCPWISVTPRHSIVSQSSHHTSIRSGDYYMFEDIDDEELDLIKEDEDESSSEGDDGDGKKRFTMSKFLSTAMKTDITKAADQALTTEEVVPTRTIKGRRASMPASMLRRKSSMSRKVAGPSSVLSAPASGATAGPSGIQLPTQARSDIGVQRRGSTTILSESQRSDPRMGRGPTDRGDEGSDDGMKFIVPKAVKEKITQRLWQSFKVLWAFFESVMVSMIRTLNKISKDYRYVVRVLAQEKREVKENEDFRKGSRCCISKVWKPEKEVIMQLGDIIATTPQGSIGRGSADESTTPMDSPKEDRERLNRSERLSHP
ncbi:hypothetical protein RUM44_005301, partial [Polyplax serrata]